MKQHVHHKRRGERVEIDPRLLPRRKVDRLLVLYLFALVAALGLTALSIARGEAAAIVPASIGVVLPPGGADRGDPTSMPKPGLRRNVALGSSRTAVKSARRDNAHSPSRTKATARALEQATTRQEISQAAVRRRDLRTLASRGAPSGPHASPPPE